MKCRVSSLMLEGAEKSIDDGVEAGLTWLFLAGTYLVQKWRMCMIYGFRRGKFMVPAYTLGAIAHRSEKYCTSK